MTKQPQPLEVRITTYSVFCLKVTGPRTYIELDLSRAHMDLVFGSAWS